MPLWNIYTPEGTFVDKTSRAAISADITKMYTGIGLPAFYVVVNFISLKKDDQFVGGESVVQSPDRPPFIRISIDHIAVTQPNNNAAYLRVVTGIDRLLKPHIADKGYDWEFHVNETERRLWKVNGYIPPKFGSEGEKLWVQKNKAVDFE